MKTTDLGADECLDPALMTAFEDGAVDPFGQWHCADADAGPPSPFDMSTIDPDLLALYPEQNGGVDCNAASPPLVHSEAPDRSPSPLPIADASPIPHSRTTDIAVPTAEDNIGSSPPTKRVRFATLPPGLTGDDAPSPSPQSSAPTANRPLTRAQTRKRPPRLSRPALKKHSALGVAKRTISDGWLVPPYSCARCVWEDEECLIKYAGAACNVCRRRGRKCDLVDELVKFNGQRAKDLMRADGSGNGFGIGCVGVV